MNLPRARARLEDRYPEQRIAFAEGAGHSFIGGTPAVTHSASLQALAATIAFFDQELQIQRRQCAASSGR